MNRFPIIGRIRVENYRLYPGTAASPGLDFEFKQGISLLAGINGLGKTTLMTMMFRLIVGAADLGKDDSTAKFGAAARPNVIRWPIASRYFTQRVADKAADATAQLWFSIGAATFRVKRSLATLRLLECTLNGVDIPTDVDERAYRRALCDAADASVFVDFLTAVKYLTFFNEDRRDILWDEQAQRQFFRILFSTPQEAQAWIELEQRISRHDSRARNHSYSAKQYEDDLARKQRALVQNAGKSAELAATQRLLDADLLTLETMRSRAVLVEEDLNETRRDLERAKLIETDVRRAVEQLRFTAIDGLFPDISETAKYVLTQLYSEGLCLACEQVSQEAGDLFDRALVSHECAVCGQSLPTSRIQKTEEKVDRDALASATQSLDTAILQTNTLGDREIQLSEEWRAISTAISETTIRVTERTQSSNMLRAQLPPDPEEIETIRRQITSLRATQAEEEARRLEAEMEYQRLLETVNGRIQERTIEVANIFQNLIHRFLEETCTLSYGNVKSRPSQNGKFFTYSALKFQMTAAAFEGQQFRETPDDVSESQREFIDLAFRMALMEAASEDGMMSLVIETPEASLDAIFMERAASLFLNFAQGPRSVIVTSNLTSSVMIPALMGAPTNDNQEIELRRSRVLNLLDVAASNAATSRHKSAYDTFLEKGIRGERS